MTLELTPRPDEGAVRVEVRVSGAPAREVRELHVTRSWAGTKGAEAIGRIEVRDDLGDVPPGAGREDGGERIHALGRAPVGDLVVRYTARSGGARFGLRVIRDRMTGVGHGFLLLPRIEAPVPARIRWRLEALGPGARGASSFGEGDAAFTVTSGALAHAVYAAGALEGAAEGGERLVALGARSIDAREALAWTARVRALAAARFEGGAPAGGGAPFTVFLLGEPGIGEDHDGAFLGGAAGLWFDGGRRFDPQVRVALAHELIHRHLGGDLQLLDDAGRPAAWFAEGFTVHYARKLLFDAALITAEDFVADVQRIDDEAAAASGPRAAAPPFPLSTPPFPLSAPPFPAAAPPSPALLRADDRGAYFRGSRYAAHLDHALRRASKGARSLDDLLRALRARGPAPLRLADLRAALDRELGAGAGADLDRVLDHEPLPPLPSGAYGPCFHRPKDRQPVFELGFDPESLDRAPSLIRGLLEGSAAEKAGLREGALVLLAKRIPGPTDGPKAEVDITIADRRGGKRIRYKPSAIRDIGRWRPRPCKRP